MANITSSFTQLLPTELYVAGISTNISGSYTYNGPETFDVWVDIASGNVIQIGVNGAVPPGGTVTKIINASDSTQLPAAYVLSHTFHDNYTWNYTYSDEVQSNGDVYKKIDNPDLRDAYEVIYNFTNSKFELKQIIKELINPNADEAVRRRDFVKIYSDQYDFGDTVNTKIDHYLAGIGTYLAANPYHKKWKYVTLPDAVGTIPKIPADIQIELQKVSMSGIGGNV
jgi:hypothetical protein